MLHEAPAMAAKTDVPAFAPNPKAKAKATAAPKAASAETSAKSWQTRASADAYAVAAAPAEPREGVPVWILDSGSGNHLACEKRLSDELRESIRRNATMVKMATANGPATATDVVDVGVPGLDAHARVLLLRGCPAEIGRAHV